MIFLNINDNLKLNIRAREWCKLPYPNHPKGCPNYGKKSTCPPEAPFIDEFFNLERPVHLIGVSFNLAEHIKKMKHKHPHFSDSQARCVLYWQGSVNRKLREKCSWFLQYYPDAIITLCPEAMGVNVISTARACGLPIELKPQKLVLKIALAGYPFTLTPPEGNRR